jgi:hypothetical protein
LYGPQIEKGGSDPAVSQRLRVVGAGAAPGNPRPEGLPQDYILFVGNRGQYKDARVLLKSFSELMSRGTDLELVFVGGGAFTPEEARELQNLGISARTHQFSLPDSAMAGA